MITIDKIKEVLFSEQEDVLNFIVEANEIQPPIHGDSFDEKLSNLLRSDNDRATQLLLAPFLRKRVFRCLNQEETVYAQDTKREYITVEGQMLFDRFLEDPNLTENARRYSDARDFQSLKRAFKLKRGKDIWLEQITAEKSRDNLDPLFYRVKNDFLGALSEYLDIGTDHPQAIWERAHHSPPHVQDFDKLKYAYIRIWGNEYWNICFAHQDRLQNSPQAVTEISDEEDLQFPSPPSAEDEFLQAKNRYIEKYGINRWSSASAFPELSEELIGLSYQYKNQFIEQAGEQQWLLLFPQQEVIKAFHSFKNHFITVWGFDIWEKCFTDTDLGTVDQRALFDFTASKYLYLNKFVGNQRIQQLFDATRRETEQNAHNHENLIVNFQNRVTSASVAGENDVPAWEEHKQRADELWEHSKTYPAIPPESKNLIEQHINRFVDKWGTNAWNTYLRTHSRNAEYATDVQLKILGQLFDLNIQITDISPRRTNIYVIPTETPNAPLVEFYCEQNNHYYINEGGYSETIGNGNCGYNGFAQWLKLLLLNQRPRRLVVLADPNDMDVSSFFIVQRALYPKPSNAASSSELVPVPNDMSKDQISDLVRLDNQISINSIRKELDLPIANAPTKELGRFIKTKANALIHFIRAKNLPFSNRLRLLNKIAQIATSLGEQSERQADLMKLQRILLFVTNTTYLPHGQDVSKDWTQSEYNQNLENLKKAAANDNLPVEIFQNLGAEIVGTNFQSNTLESFTGYIKAAPFSQAVFAQHHDDEDNGDWLAAGLCITGIFMLITSITFLASLLVIALTGGLVHLGLLLMEAGLTSIAVSLGNVIGLSAPFTATIIATGASCMLAGLGFTLFKDFAPQSIGSESTFMPGSSLF